MTTIYLTMEDGLLVVERYDGRWQARDGLGPERGLRTMCMAADPLRPEVAYCGTFGGGLWRSDDAGRTWAPVGDGIGSDKVSAVAVSRLERADGNGVVWAGVEMSALYRSEDGGRSWQERPALSALPSAPTWSFPPRPNTHHVRWIMPDPADAGRLFVSIEAGGVMRSFDGGLTFEDRKPDGPWDAHTLAMHPTAPGRLYTANGDGFRRPGDDVAVSQDGGATWGRLADGIEHHYGWGLAVDSGDPDTLVMTCADGPQQAHSPFGSASYVYRRGPGEHWQLAMDGLPTPQGTRAFTVAADAAASGNFYAVGGSGLYRSPDAGRHWERLVIDWPERFTRQHASGLAVGAG